MKNTYSVSVLVNLEIDYYDIEASDENEAKEIAERMAEKDIGALRCEYYNDEYEVSSLKSIEYSHDDVLADMADMEYHAVIEEQNNAKIN